jgi:hypothetical protein
VRTASRWLPLGDRKTPGDGTSRTGELTHPADRRRTRHARAGRRHAPRGVRRRDCVLGWDRRRGRARGAGDARARPVRTGGARGAPGTRSCGRGDRPPRRRPVHPFSPGLGTLNDSEHYAHTLAEYAQVARRQLVCAMQVHVAVGTESNGLCVTAHSGCSRAEGFPAASRNQALRQGRTSSRRPGPVCARWAGLRPGPGG